MSAVAFAPPVPVPRGDSIAARPFPLRLLAYFSTLARNPLETWGEDAFRTPIIDLRFLGRRFLILNDPAAIRHCFVTEAEKYPLGYIRVRLLEPMLRDGLIVAEGDLWRTTRRALTPVFTPRHVSGFAEAMRRVAMRRRDALAARVGAPFGMAAEMLDLALVVLMACLFSPDDELDRARFSASITALLELGGIPHPLDVMRAPDWAPRYGRGKMRGHIESLRTQVAALIEGRRRRGVDDQAADFLSLLMRAGKAEGSPLSDDIIVDNLLTFIAAGHETTARSLAWTFYLLSEAPDIDAAVAHEIRSATLSQTPPEEWAARLPLLEATIKESMRLYPPAPHIARQCAAPDRFGDLDIAPGTEVHMSPWLLHRQEGLWASPQTFNPRRFLDGPPVDRFAFLPFGVGPRVCIGASFSMQEMIIVLAILLRDLKFRHVGEAPPIPVLRVTLQPTTPIEMKSESRG
jgi:cytochrome P450